MSKLKRPLGINVLEASASRIAFAFDHFTNICVSFSAGKDSTVMLHLAAAEARKRKRRISVLLIDLEAQYEHTIAHAEACFDMYSDVIDPYWVCLPLNLRNAVSQFQPFWKCWDPNKKDSWVRSPPKMAITDPSYFPFYRDGMEFEEFVPEFGLWLANGEPTACLVGIRSDESLNRFRTLIMDKQSYEEHRWTTWISDAVYNVYPIYDWKTADIWVYGAKTGLAQNPIYELMTKAGVPLSSQRICQPYGDYQRRGLWLYHILEPHNWSKILNRVYGVNAGSLYAKERGRMTGAGTLVKPEHLSWEAYSSVILGLMPPKLKAHYESKIWVFLRWWAKRDCPVIPDEADPKLEASRKAPSWRRICKVLLRNDYWCKGLSFSQQKSGRHEAYLDMIRKRREKWKSIS